jgi:carbonic anhydrase
MKRLYKGILKFQESYFKKERKFFRRLSNKQEPDVLFITCADARVYPTLVTQSKPGELFIVRNVGNIVPPYGSIQDKNSVAAALEFAVLKLKVTDIIVCGHSNCGAMQALAGDGGDLSQMPHLRDWLHVAAPVRDAVDTYYAESSGKSHQRVLEEVNVLTQLKNIQTYPFVSEAIVKEELFLHGWYYEIVSGKVYIYDPKTNIFKNLILHE